MDIMGNLKKAIAAARISDEILNWYAFEGPFGEVVHNGRYFFAWKEDILIGTYDTLKESVEALKPREGRNLTVKDRLIEFWEKEALSLNGNGDALRS